jgi:hypothetical protein
LEKSSARNDFIARWGKGSCNSGVFACQALGFGFVQFELNLVFDLVFCVLPMSEIYFVGGIDCTLGNRCGKIVVDRVESVFAICQR